MIITRSVIDQEKAMAALKEQLCWVILENEETGEVTIVTNGARAVGDNLEEALAAWSMGTRGDLDRIEIQEEIEL